MKEIKLSTIISVKEDDETLARELQKTNWLKISVI
jgi:hypothetical protein